jgi:hypothetical protein
MIDFDRVKMNPLSPDAAKRFAFALDQSDTTVPKALREDAGYKSFKKGYMEKATELGEEFAAIAERVLGICEAKSNVNLDH